MVSTTTNRITVFLGNFCFESELIVESGIVHYKEMSHYIDRYT